MTIALADKRWLISVELPTMVLRITVSRKLENMVVAWKSVFNSWPTRRHSDYLRMNSYWDSGATSINRIGFSIWRAMTG